MLPRMRYSLDNMIPWIILAAMNPTLKAVLFAAFWFVLGHLSCAVMHHFHHHMAR